MSAWNLAAVEGAFAAAATEPSLWGDALAALARETGSVGAVIVPIRGRTPFNPVTDNLSEVNDFYFKHGWHTRDRRYGVVPRLVREGIGVDYDFTDDEKMRRDPYYQEFLALFDLKWFAAIRLQAGDDLWSLSIQRSSGQGPFLPEEQKTLADFGGRVSTAATLSRSIGAALVDGMAEAFEYADIAAIFLDRQGVVVRVNAKAERLLGAELQVVGRFFVPADPALRPAIERAVRTALGIDGIISLPLPVAVPKAAGRPFVLHVLPLAGNAALVLSPARAVILVRSPDDSKLPPEAHLNALFGLTRAEARLALQLSSGDGLARAAERLGVTCNTAHSQLRAIFAKTGTNRQGELIRVLAQLGFLASPAE